MTIKKMIQNHRMNAQSEKEFAAQALKIRTNLYQASHGDFANLPDFYSMPATDIKDTTMTQYGLVVPVYAW